MNCAEIVWMSSLTRFDELQCRKIVPVFESFQLFKVVWFNEGVTAIQFANSQIKWNGSYTLTLLLFIDNFIRTYESGSNI